MPTYPYACTECGHRFEAVQAFSDESLTVCPVCSGKLRKVFSSVGIVFKGSGFYRNDSRGGAVPKGESSSESKGGSTTETKVGETKAPATAPAEKAAPKPSSSPASSS